MDLDLSVEISALEHVFGPFQNDADDLATARELSLTLSPYTGDDETVFVDMDATFRMGMRYPDEPPTVDITSSRGLSDQRIRLIVRAMQEEARELAGEHMLMSMCMAAKDTLSQLNHPEGVCPFCLETMQDASQCMRGACFHGVHRSCFRHWWQWRVREHELQLKEREENRRTIGLGVAPKEQQDMRQAVCPVCRAGIPQDQLACVLLPSEVINGYPSPDTQRAASNADEDEAAPLDSSLVAFIESVSSVHKKIAAEQKANQDRSTACTA